MRVAVLCEFSGIVRDAFTRLGHEAVSCDLLPTETPGDHIQDDCRAHDWSTYDLIIAHPPCQHLAVSGARWFSEKQPEQTAALAFVRYLLSLEAPRLALENPVSIISSRIRKPDQIIQPWQHGHPETKATCLWLQGLPQITATAIVTPTEQRVWRMADSKGRWMRRSRTLTGIAAAMADQWGGDHATLD